MEEQWEGEAASPTLIGPETHSSEAGLTSTAHLVTKTSVAGLSCNIQLERGPAWAAWPAQPSPTEATPPRSRAVTIEMDVAVPKPHRPTMMKAEAMLAQTRLSAVADGGGGRMASLECDEGASV